MTPLLSVRGLRVTLALRNRSITPVDGVDLDIDPGETVALVGESGSGKSVFALSLLRLLPHPPATITGGTALYRGEDLFSLSAAQVRRLRGGDIGFIFQEPMTALNPVLTVGRQLTEAAEEHLALTARQAQARAIELLKMVEVADPARRLRAYPHQFSGGMRQRVMIAMAISCNPKLIIADEPTTALDVITQAQILDLLKAVTSDSGAAVLLITHDLGVVARYASRINVMYAGRIVEQGRADAVFRAPNHPYTRGLIASVPRVDRALDNLAAIPGLPPDPARLPQGCAFHPRCSLAFDRCRTERPPLAAFDAAGTAACWHAISTRTAA
jgi:oligopeptide/dipeptide ABC transporter ATP-binding protein